MSQELTKYLQYTPLVLLGFAFAILFTPLIIRFALKYGVYDKPKSLVGKDKTVIETNMHDKIMPRMGFVAVITPVILFSLFFIPINFQIIVIFLALVVLSVYGVFDDKYRLPAAQQFIVQILCILAVVLSGVTITETNNPFTGSFLNFERANISFNIFGNQISWSLLSIFVSFLWLFFITNVINWADGIDGVLNGTVAIASLIILLVSIRENSVTSAVISAIFLGANLGHLRYNFNPAKIINGFGGPIYGFLIGILAILGQVKLSIALIALIFPILDAFWVIIYRVKKFKPKTLKEFLKAISTGGKVHFHHRLMHTGLKIRDVALITYLCTGLAGLVAMLLSGLELTFLIFGSILIVLLIFIFLDRILKRKETQI